MILSPNSKSLTNSPIKRVSFPVDVKELEITQMNPPKQVRINAIPNHSSNTCALHFNTLRQRMNQLTNSADTCMQNEQGDQIREEGDSSGHEQQTESHKKSDQQQNEPKKQQTQQIKASFSLISCLKHAFKSKEVKADEFMTLDEQNRRFQVAMRGWKKVRSVLTVIRYKRMVGILDNYMPVQTKWSYENILLLPFSNFRYYFLLVESSLVLYNVMIVPFRYSFKEINNDTFQLIDIIMDAFFLCAVIMKFFCAYVDKTRMIKEFRQIAYRYIFGFLWMDFSGLFIFEVISLFPYYLFSDWYGVRFLRVLQVGSVIEYYSNFCNKTLAIFTSNINLTKSLTTILVFLQLLCILAQYLSCFWYYLGIEQNIEEGYDKSTKQMRMMSGWVYEQLYSSIPNGETQIGSNVQTEYIASLYWVFTTLTTLGYGDFYGQTMNEYLFTMFVEFIGVFIFAYMMGNINNLIEKLNDDHLEYIQNENENLDQWIIKIDRANPTRKLPQAFVDDLRKRFTIYWQRDHTTVVEEFPFFNQLPVDLRAQLVDHIFKGFIERFSVFFSGLEIQFIQAVVVNLYPKKFTQAEHEGRKQIDIISIDTCPSDIFFITKGEVTIASKDGVHKYIHLNSGSYFGDHLVLYNLKSSNAFMAIDEDVECMCIERKKFLELCDFYPYSHKVLKYKAYARRKHFREMKLRVMDQEDNFRQKPSSHNQIPEISTLSQPQPQQSGQPHSFPTTGQKSPFITNEIEANVNNNNNNNNNNNINNTGKLMGETTTVKRKNTTSLPASRMYQSMLHKEGSPMNYDNPEIPNFIQLVDEDQLKKASVQQQILIVDRIQDRFKKYIEDNSQKILSSSCDSNQFNGQREEDEKKQAEILKLAKDLNDKIEILKKSLCSLDSDIKNKITDIKTELEFITSYEEVLHDYDEDGVE